MIEKGEIKNAAITSVGLVFILYHLTKSLLLITCGDRGYALVPYDPTTTSFVLATSIGLLAFIFFVSTGAFGNPNRVDKIFLLIGIGWFLLWTAHSFIQSNLCTVQAVRTMAAYLMVPIALLALGVFGRRWLSSADD